MEQENIQSLEDIIVLIDSKSKSFKFNYENKNFRECVISLYFVAENLIRYILAVKGFYPKSHEGAHILLAQHFIKTDTIDKESYNFITNLYLRRKDAEYRGFVSFDQKDVKKYAGWVIAISEDCLPFFKPKHKKVVSKFIKDTTEIIK